MKKHDVIISMNKHIYLRLRNNQSNLSKNKYDHKKEVMNCTNYMVASLLKKEEAADHKKKHEISS
jgi:hypothetical protein